MLYFLRLEKQEGVDAFLSDVRLSGGLKAQAAMSLELYQPWANPCLCGFQPVSSRRPASTPG
ncbi:MAG: hypothetical protein ABSE39_00585 [Candidatus Bathyarchaeia archaeon]